MKILLLIIAIFAFAKAQDDILNDPDWTWVETVYTEIPQTTPTPCIEDPNCVNIGVWDQESCQCIQIVCDPAPGCGNWIGYPTCKCTSCDTEVCPGGSPRSPDNGCMCPAIICPEIPGCVSDPETCACIGCWEDLCWDRSARKTENNCQCPPEYACDPAFPFPENKIWLGAPDCYFICDPNLPACPRELPRDPETCQCEPQVVCDPMWPPPYPANQWLPYPDCKWACVPENCLNGQRWSKKQCKCVESKKKCFPVKRN